MLASEKLWIGGLVSAAVMVLVVSAYVFSNGYLHQYPIERVTGDSSFACDVTMRNAKFSTTIQMISNSRSSTKDNQAMFDMLNSQPFTLNIDLVQTAFTCEDSLVVQRLIAYTLTQLPIATCQTSHNNSILSLGISLPAQVISVQLTLPGSRTIGAIRIGLSGPSAVSADGR
ncbi:unnamed protein product [Didymodactylos carnosus]|uniref:Uncharacterized protein n=1 Tax=Didymodactylos carnosus TaxID=1234261 RepID=A0A814GBT8_9BILA|nr:unnamed protein product [Didymodactylos carnosus]CAF3764143.1 unnamed protein product [Didymodactylos carnosus]